MSSERESSRDPSGPAPGAEGVSGPWWKTLDRYMWGVLIVAVLAWVLEGVDQPTFVLSRGPAIDDLLSVEMDERDLHTKGAAKNAALLGVEPGAGRRPEERILDAIEGMVLLEVPDKVQIEEP